VLFLTHRGSFKHQAGVLEVRAARALLEGVSIDGGGPGDSGCLLPRSGSDVPRFGMNPGGYTPGDGGFGLYAVYSLG